jgi:hypothetical protein
MMDDKDKKSKPSQLFMLRIWLEEIREGQTDWRGRAQHVSSGEVKYFRNWQMLRDFMEEKLRQQEFMESNEPEEVMDQ